jgi:hypothetical protein
MHPPAEPNPVRRRVVLQARTRLWGGWIALATALFTCEYAEEAPSAAPESLRAPRRKADAPGSAELDAWLSRLASAESDNRPRLVHRRDGQLYYGCLQFQIHTFRVYARKFHLLPKDNISEAISRIYDCAFQKRLAALMIRDDPGNWKYWKGTVENKVGLPPVSRRRRTPRPPATPSSQFSANTNR